MSLSTQTVLEKVVSRVEESDTPVSTREIAAALSVPEQEVVDALEELREFELIAVKQEGYRPTVTGYELLETDISLDEMLVFDVVDG